MCCYRFLQVMVSFARTGDLPPTTMATSRAWTRNDDERAARGAKPLDRYAMNTPVARPGQTSGPNKKGDDIMPHGAIFGLLSS